MPGLSCALDIRLELVGALGEVTGSADLSGEDRGGATVTIRTVTDRHPESGTLPRLAYSVDEAATVLGVARETIYELIRRGELRSRKAGSRRIIGRHHLLEFLDGGGSLPDKQAG